MTIKFISNNVLTIGAVFIFTGLLGACGTSIGSSAVTTGEIYATIEVSADNTDTIKVNALLTKKIAPAQVTDATTYVNLDSHDQLWASNQNNLDEYKVGSKPFSELQSLIQNYVVLDTNAANFLPPTEQFKGFDAQFHLYQATLADTPESHFYVNLLRDGEASSAYSDVILPHRFLLLEPVKTASFSRASQDILVRWDTLETQAANVTVTLSVVCNNGARRNAQEDLFVDSGNLLVPAGTLSSPSLSGTCATTVSVEKTHIGNLDSRFYGGIITGVRQRSLSFVTTD